MKYAILVGDGMADRPIAALGNKTPLEYAPTPAMDILAKMGRVGRVRTVPQGFEPGSDVANLSLMGYDPVLYFRGRAPLEAASMGVHVLPGETAFRCNLVHIADEVMDDYSAGHIDTADGRAIIGELADLSTDTIQFFPGISYRHLTVIDDTCFRTLKCTPPHDISGQRIESYLPTGDGAEFLNALRLRARDVLKNSPTNKRRAASGKKTVTDIWLWGQGEAMKLPTLKERYGLHGSVISAVDLVRGLGRLAGLTVRIVDGATGYLDTNYAGKVTTALDALKNEDFVFVHVEAPDETSHEGSLGKKLKAITDFDAQVVSFFVNELERRPDLRVLVMPDHATLLSTRTHDAEPVPFVMAGAHINPTGAAGFSETIAADATPLSGPQLFESFITMMDA